MENIFVSVISLALIIISTVTMTFSTMKSTSELADSIKQMEAQSSIKSRTDINAIPPEQYLGGIIDIIIVNEGQTNLGSFPDWDAIVQYEDGSGNYLTYTTSYPPGENQWTVEGLYLSNGDPEIFNPNILDPGEQMTVSIELNPDLGTGESASFSISTPYGVKSRTYVTTITE
ncbi:MAG: hypothetical protein JW967_11645 [Dehalococcoidales bacterium]|nr:hypothetical protein [Dehalococcoidales bacterium]